MKTIKFLLALFVLFSLIYCLLPSSAAALNAAHEAYGVPLPSFSGLYALEISILIYRLSFYVFKTVKNSVLPLFEAITSRQNSRKS